MVLLGLSCGRLLAHTRINAEPHTNFSQLFQQTMGVLRFVHCMHCWPCRKDGSLQDRESVQVSLDMVHTGEAGSIDAATVLMLCRLPNQTLLAGLRTVTV
jgi:hypothetical protein